MRQSRLLIGMLAVMAAFLLDGSAQGQDVSSQSTTTAHPKGGFVRVNGSDLWYETEGKGEPLLLISGAPGASHTYFHPHFSSLAESFQVIYFDGFGRGRSARATTAKEYSFDRDVEDIEGLRKALRLDQINVLGHSYGGMVAQAYALRYPNSVKKLILSNTLFSAEMWQAGVNNFNQIIQDQCPEVWTKLQQLRAEGFHSSAREYQEANYSVPLGLFYFFDSSNVKKIAADPAPFNPDVFYTIVGDDAFFLAMLRSSISEAS